MRETKDSGVKWIKQIPVRWNLKKLKYLTVKCERGTSPDYTDGIATMVVNQATFSKGFFDASNIRYSKKPALTSRGLLHKGDVLLASTGGGVLGKSYYFDEDGIYVADSHVTVVRTKEELCSKYLYYYFSVNFDTFNSQMAVGATNQTELQRDLLCEMIVPLPAIIEQKKIVDFLDIKCAEIDLLISDIQTQIDTLEQYKRSVITESVTKGLNPNAEMKDSGIPWIGMIPSYWKCIRGKYILEYLQKPVKQDDEIITCFRDGEVTLRSNRREDGFTVANKEIGYQGIDVGDLVVHGMDGFSGAIGVSDSRGKASPVLNVLDTEQDKRYIMYFLRSMAYSDVFLAMATGIRVRSCDLRWNKLSELMYPIPPLDEQKGIVAYIDDILKKVNAVIAEKKEQLETLDAYKKSLIFEYVTGKKEVPEPITVVSIDPHVLRLAMIADMPKRAKGEIADQKLLYLCDTYLGLGLSTQYYRYDYGPFDLQLYSYIDTLVSNGWYTLDTKDRAKILVKAEKHAEALEMYGNQLSQNKSDIEKLVQYFGDMRMGEIERFATLFAVWNDFIIDGVRTPSDNQIIDDVLTNWGPKKGRFSRDTWQNTLMKMKRDGIIPKGLGLHTLPKPEGGKSDA